MLSTETATTVELRGLCKRFKKRDVLIDINLKVSSGETVCVLGTSGSGKSTLLRCINWLEVPEFGEVYLYNKRVDITHQLLIAQLPCQRGN